MRIGYARNNDAIYSCFVQLCNRITIEGEHARI